MTIRSEIFVSLSRRVLLAVILLIITYKYKQFSFTTKVVIVPIGAYPEFRHKTIISEDTLFGPYNTTEVPVEDTYDRLFDVQNFSFIANTPVCDGHPAGLLLVVVVSSSPAHFKNREVIRNTWGRNLDTMKLVFLLGETADSKIANQVSDEIHKFGDIVQGTFTDAYRNMTYKHVMGLKWVAHHCPRAKYVLKTDDDVLVYSGELRRFLVKELSPWGARDLLAGQIMKGSMSLRGPSKWKVTMEEYPGKYYPTYLLGWAILYSQHVVRRLLKVSQDIPYFWIDDVYVTGLAAEKIGVTHTSLASFVLNDEKLEKLKKTGSISRDDMLMFGMLNLGVAKIEELWNLVQNRSEY